MKKEFYELYWLGRSGKKYSFSCWAVSEEEARELFEKRFNGTKTVIEVKVYRSEDVIAL